ncbi:hypothetical protein RC083_17360 [Pseudoalteromonas haloplanktis]|uniref:Uncharacterized protein n=1 Tax=Pseudoalteromonas haloplanktis TaxID=228 RepID=A0ABU1BG77_PSEHA|nr:hypothetical protein [Pseudoalteromonas haloplanktis]MDQ9093350.1 hypothetical protein [Pseudoalteromonas haloplanktis]
MDILGVEGPSLCSYTDLAEFASPSGEKIAKLGYSDCGATANWQTGVSIVDVKLGKEYNGFFGLDGKPENLKVLWTSDMELTFSDFPIGKLLWFSQDYMSGVKVKIETSMVHKQIQPMPNNGSAD